MIGFKKVRVWGHIESTETLASSTGSSNLCTSGAGIHNRHPTRARSFCCGFFWQITGYCALLRRISGREAC